MHIQREEPPRARVVDETAAEIRIERARNRTNESDGLAAFPVHRARAPCCNGNHRRYYIAIYKKRKRRRYIHTLCVVSDV